MEAGQGAQPEAVRVREVRGCMRTKLIIGFYGKIPFDKGANVYGEE